MHLLTTINNPRYSKSTKGRLLLSLSLMLPTLLCPFVTLAQAPGSVKAAFPHTLVGHCLAGPEKCVAAVEKAEPQNRTQVMNCSESHAYSQALLETGLLVRANRAGAATSIFQDGPAKRGVRFLVSKGEREVVAAFVGGKLELLMWSLPMGADTAVGGDSNPFLHHRLAPIFRAFVAAKAACNASAPLPTKHATLASMGQCNGLQVSFEYAAAESKFTALYYRKKLE